MQIPTLDKVINRIPIIRKYIVSWESYNALYKENHKLKGSLFMKEQELLSKEEVKKKDIPVAGFDNTDAEPVDSDKRKAYVTEVDIFYDFALKDKLKTSIADIREMLSNIHVARGFPQNMQRNEYDFFLRGMEAMAWKMDEWAITCQGERRENLQDKEN